jgi:hypothetical protein
MQSEQLPELRRSSRARRLRWLKLLYVSFYTSIHPEGDGNHEKFPQDFNTFYSLRCLNRGALFGQVGAI